MSTESAAGTKRAVKKRPRRRQSDRSAAMRKRLLAATLESLAEDGYTGSTLSSIVRRAGVSRGAQVHHYPSKQALMLDAAENLLRDIYRTLGELMLSVAEEDDRLQALVEAIWQQLFATRMYRAYNELLAASQRDEALAHSLRTLLLRQAEVFDAAIDHYFVAAPGSNADIKAVFVQFTALLHGLVSHAHVTPGAEFISTQLSAWIRHANAHMRARKGVRTPPPKPSGWSGT